MHRYFVTGSAISNGRTPGRTGIVVILLSLVEDQADSRLVPVYAHGRKPAPTGTVAILLALVENEAGAPSIRAHAAKVLADLRAVDALPMLSRLARFSSEAEVRTAAGQAFERITRERQIQQPGRRRQGFWCRLQSVLRNVLRHPCW